MIADPSQQCPGTSPGPSPGRGVLSALLGLSVLGLCLLVFLPIASLLGHLVASMGRMGALTGLPLIGRAAFWSFFLNVLMFIPAFLLASFMWPRISRRTLMLIAMTATITIETIQGLFLPRSANVYDIVANSLGGAIGILLGTWAWVALKKSRNNGLTGRTAA